MRYEILGPLRVTDEAGSRFISAPKIETLLATLLIRSDQLMAADKLIQEIWGDRPPRRATASLHVYISELRKFLNRPGHPGRPNPIETKPPGYLLRMGADELDVNTFLGLVKQGKANIKEGYWEEAAGCFESALELWRGPVLSDCANGPIVDGFVAWLMEARTESTELLIDAQLQLGRHRELVGQLYSLTAEFPLRETFYRQLMLALYRSERRADALTVYQVARRVLDEELGLQPCRALQEMQRDILAADDHALGLYARL